eukprot:CAMPEP_0119043862 /NCGR_PEP_ID=MMETSP1177-20130426/26426_1 /TAXON_ID=2985 /ORGANISM="Ochromonas sp, Strain CCMP1899" /LENGTH=181 /DNA_ID=CAMNT_0007012875 /DNA_START=21 /DNA_END=562 /DNA_ORIENTATION=-
MIVEEREVEKEIIVEKMTEVTELLQEKKVKPPVEVLTKEQEERIVEVESFLDSQGVKVNRRKKKLLAFLPKGSYETYKLGVIIANCCKDMDLGQGVEAYLRAKQEDVKPNNATFANLLSLTAGFGDQGSSLAPIRTVVPPTNMDSAFMIFKDMKEALYVFNESIYSAMIRCCILNNDLKKA